MWLRNQTIDGNMSIHNIHIVMPESTTDKMGKLMDGLFGEWIYGDYTKWCSSFIAYPFMPLYSKAELNSSKALLGYVKTLTINGIDTGVYSCCVLPDYNDCGFNLGEYYYEPRVEGFEGYEPYTELRAYLPYYGYVDIPIADVAYKYIEFRLFVDFNSGQAQYVVGVNDKSVVSSDCGPFRYKGTSFIDDSETRIILSVTFSLGYNIPLGQSGMAEAIRNTIMAGIKGAATIAGVAVAGAAGGYVANSVSNAIETESTDWTRRSPKTGRQIKVGTKTTTTEQTRTVSKDLSGMGKRQMVNACFDTAVDALNSFTLRANTEVSNNAFVMYNGPQSIILVEKCANIEPTNEAYGYTYGYPLGKSGLVSTLRGYTELSAFHLEGYGFERATQEELTMLETALEGGFIL